MKKILILGFFLFIGFSMNAQTWGYHAVVVKADSAKVGLSWHGITCDTCYFSTSQFLYSPKSDKFNFPITPVMQKELAAMLSKKTIAEKALLQGQIDGVNSVLPLKLNSTTAASTYATITKVDTAKANIRSEMSNNINYVRDNSQRTSFTYTVESQLPGGTSVAPFYNSQAFTLTDLFSKNWVSGKLGVINKTYQLSGLADGMYRVKFLAVNANALYQWTGGTITNQSYINLKISSGVIDEVNSYLELPSTAETNFITTIVSSKVTRVSPPLSTAETTGAVGNISSDNDYIYIKTAVGWKRAALSTF